MIYYIEIIKQHESTDTDINVHIKQNSIKNIALKIVKDISDNNYEIFQQLTQIQKIGIILLNGKVIVILYSIPII